MLMMIDDDRIDPQPGEVIETDGVSVPAVTSLTGAVESSDATRNY